MDRMVKLKTKYGKILTLTITKQNEESIEGIDNFGIYSKILKEEIENCYPYDKKK